MEDYDKFISLIYDTAVQPDQWKELVSQLSTRMNSNTGIFSLEKIDHSKVLSEASIGFEEEDLDAYSSYFVSKDPWLPALDTLGKNKFYSSVEAYAQKDYLNSEMYCDWGKRVHMEYATGCYLFRGESIGLRMSFQRSKREGAYTKDEIDFLNRLVPHLQKSISIQNRFNDLDVTRASTEALLDKLSYACAVVDEKMSLHYFNEEFVNLTSRYQKLVEVQNNKLVLSSSHLHDKLRKIVAECLFSVSLNNDLSMKPCTSSFIGQGLEIDVSPFSSSSTVLGVVHRRMFALITIKDQALGAELSLGFLRSAYGLTHKESLIAHLLSQGKSLNEIKVIEGISLNTVKTHMKRIFEKTETNSQNQLISLLLGGIARLK